MAGTNHFPRLRYNVERGLREVVARKHTLPSKSWEQIQKEFGRRCAFCRETANAENRGIVPDHLVPVVDYGELVLGNVVPACQTCNDSRGKQDWKSYLRARFPRHAESRIRRIQAYRLRHGYRPRTPEAVLSRKQHQEYKRLLKEFDAWHRRVQKLYDEVVSG